MPNTVGECKRAVWKSSLISGICVNGNVSTLLHAPDSFEYVFVHYIDATDLQYGCRKIFRHTWAIHYLDTSCRHTRLPKQYIHYNHDYRIELATHALTLNRLEEFFWLKFPFESPWCGFGNRFFWISEVLLIPPIRSLHHSSACMSTNVATFKPYYFMHCCLHT